MLIVTAQKQYEKDLKLCIKRNLNILILKEIINKLSKNISLPPKNKDHKLHGNWIGYRECHILSDWLLVYKKTDTHLMLARTGTHSDIF